MDILDVIILSVIEGLTEFLPISSTAHLILTSKLLGLEQTQFLKSFEIIIQLGAILAIVILYRKTLFKNFKIWKNILAAFIPTAIIGFLLYKVIKNIFFENTLIILGALFIGGILLIILEKIHKENNTSAKSLNELTLKQSVLIGVCQSLSVIPGVSRAAATIMGGLFLGANRKTAVEFSFLLAIPTMFAATILDLKEANLIFSKSEFLFLSLGFIGSFVTALIVVRWFLKFVQTSNFIFFGIYRIILSILLYIFLT